MRIFFYGTLRHDVPDNALERLGLVRALQYVGPATLRGVLWHVRDTVDQSEYPSLDPYLKDGIVHGHIYEVSVNDLPIIDGWEEYSPRNEAGSAYVRREVMLENPAEMVWVYMCNPQRPLAEDRTKRVLGRVESGDWLRRGF